MLATLVYGDPPIARGLGRPEDICEKIPDRDHAEESYLVKFSECARAGGGAP